MAWHVDLLYIIISLIALYYIASVFCFPKHLFACCILTALANRSFDPCRVAAPFSTNLAVLLQKTISCSRSPCQSYKWELAATCTEKNVVSYCLSRDTILHGDGGKYIAHKTRASSKFPFRMPAASVSKHTFESLLNTLLIPWLLHLEYPASGPPLCTSSGSFASSY